MAQPYPIRFATIFVVFQDAVVDVLTAKAKQALLDTGFRTLVVAGGVGANWKLRETLNQLQIKRHAKSPAEAVKVYFPPLSLCTDNGAMIAFAGAMRLHDARGGFWCQTAVALNGHCSILKTSVINVITLFLPFAYKSFIFAYK